MAPKLNRQYIKVLTYAIFQVSLHSEAYETILILYMHCEDGTLSQRIAFVSSLHVDESSNADLNREK